MEEKNMLNELRDEIYSDAVAHGLWDGDYLRKTLRSNHCLRDSGILQIYKIVNTERELARVNATFRVFLENQELLESVLEEDHFAEELADVIITALSAAGYLGIDIDKAVRAKMEINRGREWRHGK
jgi:NTP pyrophosphatase (non-canonical NTP hydrolase)